MTKLIHPITFIDKLIKKNERGDSLQPDGSPAGNPAWLAFDFDQDGPAAVGWDTIHLQLHQEERQNHAERRHNPWMGLHSGAAERNPDPGQRP